MAKILCIETATQICSVALGIDGKLAALRECTRKNSHAEVLSTFIQEVIQEAGIKQEDLDAVAVSKGPGSYTGLRIGVSTCKGLAYALDLPVITIPTLQSMAKGLSMQENFDAEGDLLCPMIDARRMEVYCALYKPSNEAATEIEAKIIDEASFAEELKDKRITFFGDGAEKCKENFKDQLNAKFSEKGLPSAAAMIPLASEAFDAKCFEDIAYFEPYYLKNFVAGKPSVKGLR